MRNLSYTRQLQILERKILKKEIPTVGDLFLYNTRREAINNIF